jgi:eukaryotic-like serine/threonine-protein kinase
VTASEVAQRAAEIVKDALEREPAEWPTFLDAACNGDKAVRAEAESLLSFQQEATGFIEEPAVHLAAELLAEGASLGPEARVQQYRIESLIGTGGMGEVYLATDTELKRKVALKLVQRGLNTQEILRRFRHEEEILAGLNHPHIAQLYGSGFTPEGTPFFAMEYVEGTRLDSYCHQRALTVRDRLQLFRKICSAVAYAHQHLVIHRDIKPANIRVTNAGEPKLLDFGIARLLDAPDASEHTITLPGVMTPEYASPEQVRGEKVTTATDIYSLGVVLYELLTGKKPYRLTSRRPDEVARAITEQTPEKPSTAIAGDAERNRKPQIADRKFLRGDLDNIVLMAMRKEPERRYASVALLSDDIRRHLEGRTVLARKDTLGYRAGKFIKRNKAGVAAAALVFLSLAAGIIIASYEARRAQRRFDEVRRLANSLMFEIHDSVQHLQGATATRRLIVDRALQYLDSLNAEGGGDTSLQRELATAYEKVGDIQGNPYVPNLGDSDGALTSYRKATAIREAVAKTEPSTQARIELGRSYRGLGDVMEQKGDIAECLKNYRRSLAIFEQLAADAPHDRAVLEELARALETLGDGLGRTDDTAERTRVYRRNLEAVLRMFEGNPADAQAQRRTAIALMKVAIVPDLPLVEAVDHMKRAISMLEPLAKADPQNARAAREVSYAYFQLGRILSERGDHTGALPNRQHALELRQQVAAQDANNKQARFDLATSHGELAETYVNLRRPAEALEHGGKSLELLTALTTSDPNNAVYRRNLGLCYERIAGAHAVAAAGDGTPTEQRRARLVQARDHYGKARDVFAELRDRGALMPTDTQNIDKYAAKVAEIDQTLAASAR